MTWWVYGGCMVLASCGVLLLQRPGEWYLQKLREQTSRLQKRIAQQKGIPFREAVALPKPLQRFWNKADPFAGRRQEKRDLELAEVIAFLRNLTASGREHLPGLDSLLEELAGRGGVLAPGFAAMLQLVRQNQMGEALEAFALHAGEKEGKDLGRLLLEWDRIGPEELSETLLSYQKHLKEVRFTLQKKRDELLSDLLYLPVVCNVLLVFFNFVYVGCFLEQKELMDLFL
ncbi:MAG: hypothetical protein E7223_06610 [Clostridiales bacterium]|nr:hypothetical protein [Clostridiales bacterium]